MLPPTGSRVEHLDDEPWCLLDTHRHMESRKYNFQLPSTVTMTSWRTSKAEQPLYGSRFQSITVEGNTSIKGLLRQQADNL